MTSRSTSSPRETDLTRTYILVVLVEIATLGLLYALGRIFN